MKRIVNVLFLVLGLSILSSSCQKVDLSGIESRLQTLESFSIATIREQINRISSALPEMQNTETQLSNYISDMQSALDNMGDEIPGLSSAISDLKSKDSSFSKQLSELKKYVDTNSSNLKKWVQDSYVTIKKFDALQEQVKKINTTLSSITSRLDKLDQSTSTLASNLKTETSKLNKSLTACQESIRGITSDLELLKGNMKTALAQISDLLASVQSIVVVPDYSDGSVKMTNAKKNPIRFEVYPLDAAKNLAAIGPAAFSLDFVETLTKASAGIFTNMPLTSVSFNGEVLIFNIDGSGLDAQIVSGGKTANARMRVTDDTVTRSSEYFLLSFEDAPEPSRSEVAFELVDPNEIQEQSAILCAKVTVPEEKNTDTIYGFAFSDTDQNPFLSESKDVRTRSISEDGYFECEVNNLKSNTTYYYRPFVSRNGVLSYGDVSAFTTLKVEASVVTGSATEIGLLSANLHGQLLADDMTGFQIGFYVSNDNDKDTLIKNGSYYSANLNEDGTFEADIEFYPPDENDVLEVIHPSKDGTIYYVASASIHDKFFTGEVEAFSQPTLSDVEVTMGEATVNKDGDWVLNGTWTGPYDLGKYVNDYYIYIDEWWPNIFVSPSEKDLQTFFEVEDEYRSRLPVDATKISFNEDGSLSAVLKGCEYVGQKLYYEFYGLGIKGSFGTDRKDTYIAEAVDLGLPSGTKWSKYNLGSSTEEGTGDHFAWGETWIKKEYTSENEVRPFCWTG